MTSAQTPSILKFEGSMDKNWKDWIDRFLAYLDGTGMCELSKTTKAKLLMDFIGPVGNAVAKEFAASDCEDIDILIRRFNDHFGFKSTEAQARYIFFSSVRQLTQTIDEYVDILQKKAKACNFGNLMDNMIRDKIILDMKNKTLRKYLLGEANLTLDHTIDSWKTCEATENLKGVVTKPKYKSSSDSIKSCAKNAISTCGRCGTNHNSKNCPAWGQKCDNCGMNNHVAKFCTKPSTSNNNVQAERVRSHEEIKHFNSGPFTKIPKANRGIYE